MRAAQQKYQETLLEAESLMTSLIQRDEQHVGAVDQFLTAQLDYHRRCMEILDEVKGNLQEPYVYFRYRVFLFRI